VKVTDATGSRPLASAFHSLNHHTERVSEESYLPGNCETTSDGSGTVFSEAKQPISSSWTNYLLKMKNLTSFAARGSTQPRTHCHIQADMNP
jgi:hypothetical protein